MIDRDDQRTLAELGTYIMIMFIVAALALVGVALAAGLALRAFGWAGGL